MFYEDIRVKYGMIYYSKNPTKNFLNNIFSSYYVNYDLIFCYESFEDLHIYVSPIFFFRC